MIHAPDDPEPYSLERDIEFTQARERRLINKLQEIEKLCGNPDEIHSAGFVIATAVMSIVQGVAANETN